MNVTQVHAAGALTGESPLWDRARNVMWWIDIQGQRLLGHGLGGGTDFDIPLPSMPGFVCHADDGRLIVGLEDGLWLVAPESRAFDLLCPVEADEPRTRLNDGKVDGRGRIWFGSMDKTGSGLVIGALYCLTPGRELHVVRRAVAVPNAIAISPDGGTLYFTDSPTRRIERFELDAASGAPVAVDCLAVLPEGHNPDGASVDRDGGLWIAIVGAGHLLCLSPDGSEAGKIALPVSRPTMPAFGGEDLATLFVTSQRRFLTAPQLREELCAGNLLSLPAPVPGLPPPAFPI
ncbi:SMP-30/gluconolactonase/LRE family protein [Oceaniglobus trochenteri]|uniref:SMP-30/gluconolactonase/LRE family protein n=1 Tax=Oceaniglobus trochenteri TaxID=2763260 RepID=UPI001CFFD1C7|nr:SMP-30/gluconolactonase/LRE family protein [Oceaniglobus trochenteri]